MDERPKVTRKPPAASKPPPEHTRWKPGQSGNPGGRQALPEAFRARGAEALEKLVAIALTDGHDDQVRALIFVAERIFGKAAQSVEVSGAALTPAAEALIALAKRKGEAK